MTAFAPTLDDRLVWDTWLSMFHFPVVSVADEAGIFLALSPKAMTTAELAAEIKVNARALQIHLGLLASLGFVERRDGLWRATAGTRTWMHPQAQGYVGPLIKRFRENQPFHDQLLQTLRTGGRAEAYKGASAEWERGEMPPELARIITDFMNAHSQAAALAVARQALFAEVRSLMDVGGGSGIFCIEVARAWPKLKATVMEINTICVEAERYISAAGLSDRVKTQAVNMFVQPWPTGHDAHFFSNIFHDWSEETCRILAKKSFEALPPGGRILLHEMLLDDDGCGPLAVTSFAMLMLIGTKGRQYSFPELKSMLEDAGFREVAAEQTGGGYYSLVTARKPSKG
jgi:3-hydroxy-5-methyl-1-naphthoate 3-O-methyltransferase